MIIIRLFLKFVKLINSGAAPWQIAAGFAVGTVLGLTPLLSLHNLLVVCLLLIIRINITSALVATGLFSGIALVLNGPANSLGASLLKSPGLSGLWTFLSGTPVIALFNLNNTLVLGSLVIALAAAGPVFGLMLLFVRWYRTSLSEKIEKWKIVKYLKMTKLVKLYRALKG